MAAEPPPDPSDEQAQALCEVLNAYGVEYLVLGSMAARFQGVKVMTYDIDVAPAPSANNLERLADALNSLRPRWRVKDRTEGWKIDGRLEPRHFTGDQLAVGLVTRLGDLDVVFRVDGFNGNAYEALTSRTVLLTREGVEIRVAAIDDIIASKRAAGRRKDVRHLIELERFVAERDRQPSGEDPDEGRAL